MEMVRMEKDDNSECYIINADQKKQWNIEMVKQEASEADDITFQLLRREVKTIKPENVTPGDKLQSTSLYSFDPEVTSNLHLALKSETLEEDCYLGSDENVFIKQEFLHEELDIKTEDEVTQETCLDDKHNWGNQLHKHITLPSGEKSFKCNICNYTCGRKDYLKMHLRTHSGEKPFKCNICDYSCTQNGSLKSHLRTHTGEKPFKCNVCGYSCRDRCNLKSHLTTHIEEKRFKCTICEYSVGRKDYLESHLRTHTGEKPFKCNMCDNRFVWKGSLRKHFLTHSKKSVSMVIKPVDGIIN